MTCRYCPNEPIGGKCPGGNADVTTPVATLAGKTFLSSGRTFVVPLAETGNATLQFEDGKFSAALHGDSFHGVFVAACFDAETTVFGRGLLKEGFEDAGICPCTRSGFCIGWRKSLAG